jgi:hypothetical protein
MGRFEVQASSRHAQVPRLRKLLLKLTGSATSASYQTLVKVERES